MTVTVSEKGWVVIPAEMRRKYKLEPGVAVHVIDYGGVLALVPQLADPVQHAAGLLRDGESLTRALLKERRAEQRGEKRRGP